MFVVPNARHSQVAYVTADLGAAIAMFREEFGVDRFYVFSNAGVGPADGPQLKIALALVNGVEIELIEPLGDTAPLFSDVVRNKEDSSLVHFHHVAIRIEGQIENWESHQRSVDVERHPIAFAGAFGDDLRFFYTDERRSLGHYVEHVWMSEGLLAQMASAVPRHPATE